jgi:copper chaperone CopZ
MRMLLLFVIATAAFGCQRASEAKPAPRHEPIAARPAAAVPLAPPTFAAPVETRTPEARVEAAPAAACGEACGGNCGGEGSCGNCGGAGAPSVVKAVPSDAVWTQLQVDGMHCGGCARRVHDALLAVDGIFDVAVDLAAHTVKVATSNGVDGRAMAAPRIAALGYRVVGP